MTLPLHQRRAIKVAVIVGTLLAAINYGDALITGEMTTKSWFKLCLTYVVPYCVSLYSALAAQKTTD